MEAVVERPSFLTLLSCKPIFCTCTARGVAMGCMLLMLMQVPALSTSACTNQLLYLHSSDSTTPPPQLPLPAASASQYYYSQYYHSFKLAT